MRHSRPALNTCPLLYLVESKVVVISENWHYPCSSTGRNESRMNGLEESMEDEKVDEAEVWSAIRYLDPDEREKVGEPPRANIIAILALLLILGGIGVVIWLHMREL